MRIWLCPSAYAPHRGGVEELTAKLAAELERRGEEVFVVSNRWPSDLESVEMVEGQTVYRLPFTLAARNPRSLVRHALGRRQIGRELSKLPCPDLIHIICMSSQTQHLHRFALRYGIPLVLTTQGETAMDAGQIYQRNPWLGGQLRSAARDANALTACSGWTRQSVQTVAASFRSASVIPNGVDPEDWMGLPVVDRPVVAAWGRQVTQKGFDLLLDAWPHVVQQLPHATLRIGGAGPELARLQARAPKSVEFLGSLNRAAVRTLLASCRVAVVPSRVEPFGIVAVEALAAGRGLVYSSGTGLEEAAGGLGRSVDVTDPIALATAIVEELADPTNPTAGSTRAISLSWVHIAGLYRAIYARALTLPESG